MQNIEFKIMKYSAFCGFLFNLSCELQDTRCEFDHCV